MLDHFLNFFIQNIDFPLNLRSFFFLRLQILPGHKQLLLDLLNLHFQILLRIFLILNKILEFTRGVMPRLFLIHNLHNSGLFLSHVYFQFLDLAVGLSLLLLKPLHIPIGSRQLVLYHQQRRIGGLSVSLKLLLLGAQLPYNFFLIDAQLRLSVDQTWNNRLRSSTYVYTCTVQGPTVNDDGIMLT